MTMQYMLLIYEAEHIWRHKTKQERGATLDGHFALHARLKADGVAYTTQPLAPSATAKLVRARDGAVDITDGPFAETTEQLAGYYLIDCATLDDALGYAALIPNVSSGTIEVRPVADHSSDR